MNNSRKKLVFQHKLTEQLQEHIKDLEKQNKLLIEENEMLKRLNDKHKDSVAIMQAEQSKVMQEYTNGIDEINDLKSKYTKAIMEVNSIKKKYKNKMSVLLKQLKNQTK